MAQQARVSKATKNALTATNPNDFIFHSSYNTFKILATGLVSNQTISSTPTTLVLAHGMGRIPVVYAMIQFPDGRAYLPSSYQATAGSSFTRSWNVEVDATNVYFECYEDGGSYQVDIRYYLFEPTI